MGSNQSPSFEFTNHVSPRYVQPLFSQLEYGRWYTTEHLKQMLHSDGLIIEGSKTALENMSAWATIGLGIVESRKSGRVVTKAFRLTGLGKQLVDTLGTNRDLFFDLMHFLFYSAWPRSRDIKRVRYWVYSAVCDALWSDAPGMMDNSGLANRLQVEAHELFPLFQPSFSDRSVRAVFPWLGTLTPPFLTPYDRRGRLRSLRRSYCTPQLLHLATDLVCQSNRLTYGTSMSIDDQRLEAISKVCLLDTKRFWEMAELTKMAIRGFEIRKGQWGTSIALEGPPTWIELANLSAEEPHVADGDQAEGDEL